jgi:hypothetical protein
MEVKKILQDGAIFDAAVLNLTDDTILSKFQNAIRL